MGGPPVSVPVAMGQILSISLSRLKVRVCFVLSLIPVSVCAAVQVVRRLLLNKSDLHHRLFWIMNKMKTNWGTLALVLILTLKLEVKSGFTLFSTFSRSSHFSSEAADVYHCDLYLYWNCCCSRSCPRIYPETKSLQVKICFLYFKFKQFVFTTHREKNCNLNN